jgi:hypothetical protein
MQQPVHEPHRSRVNPLRDVYLAASFHRPPDQRPPEKAGREMVQRRRLRPRSPRTSYSGGKSPRGMSRQQRRAPLPQKHGERALIIRRNDYRRVAPVISSEMPIEICIARIFRSAWPSTRAMPVQTARGTEPSLRRTPRSRVGSSPAHPAGINQSFLTITDEEMTNKVEPKSHGERFCRSLS